MCTGATTHPKCTLLGKHKHCLRDNGRQLRQHLHCLAAERNASVVPSKVVRQHLQAASAIIVCIALQLPHIRDDSNNISRFQASDHLSVVGVCKEVRRWQNCITRDGVLLLANTRYVVEQTTRLCLQHRMLCVWVPDQAQRHHAPACTIALRPASFHRISL